MTSITETIQSSMYVDEGSPSPKLRSRQKTMMKSLRSQKIRDSEPRRTLIRSSYPDVQWRRLSKEDRLRERGFHHKAEKLLACDTFGVGWTFLTKYEILEEGDGGKRRIYRRNLGSALSLNEVKCSAPQSSSFKFWLVVMVSAFAESA